jgi:hypothetical protein
MTMLAGGAQQARLGLEQPMQFTIRLSPVPDRIDAVAAAIQLEDPAALVDLRDGLLRVSTWLGHDQLADSVRAAGCTVAELKALPSDCCGGCGG